MRGEDGYSITFSPNLVNNYYMNILDTIDATSFGRVVYGVVTDPQIKDMIEVVGTKEYMAQVGEWFVRGTDEDTNSVIRGMKEGKIILKPERRPVDTMVYVLYLPPYYLFLDAKKPFE